MKLLRYGLPGQEKPGLLDEIGQIRDLSSVIPDIAGETLTPEGLRGLRATDSSTLPLVDPQTRLGPCIGQVGKFICVGLNYSDFAEAIGQPLPTEPEIFLKATSALSGPNDPIFLPTGSRKTDWEVELAVVIGMKGKEIEVGQARSHVAGYCVVNDLSEREFQYKRGSQWDKGKGCDSFGPIGPWLVTADEVPDPQSLGLWLDVNEKRYQEGSTRTMIFGVDWLISYTSRFMSLHPGDIISTGTPPGVGMMQQPTAYLRSSDVVTLGVEGLGSQRQVVQ